MFFTGNIYYMKEHHKLMDRTVDRGLFIVSCISSVTFTVNKYIAKYFVDKQRILVTTLTRIHLSFLFI